MSHQIICKFCLLNWLQQQKKKSAINVEKVSIWINHFWWLIWGHVINVIFHGCYCFNSLHHWHYFWKTWRAELVFYHFFLVYMVVGYFWAFYIKYAWEILHYFYDWYLQSLSNNLLLEFQFLLVYALLLK